MCLLWYAETSTKLGQSQKIWIVMLKLPDSLQRPTHRGNNNVIRNDPDHLYLLSGCNWGSARYPTNPARACPHWSMFEYGHGTAGQGSVNAANTPDDDLDDEIEAEGGENAGSLDTGVQYCIGANYEASRCGWAAECKPQAPPNTLLLRVVWGVNLVLKNLGICAPNRIALSALSESGW